MTRKKSQNPSTVPSDLEISLKKQEEQYQADFEQIRRSQQFIEDSIKSFRQGLLNVVTDTIVRHFTKVFVFEVYKYIFTDPKTKKLNPELGDAFLGLLQLDELEKLANELSFEWSEGEKTRHAEITSWLIDEDGKFISKVVSILRDKMVIPVPIAAKYLCGQEDVTLDVVSELVKEKYGDNEEKWLNYGGIYKQVTLMKDWLKKQNIIKLHQV